VGRALETHEAIRTHKKFFGGKKTGLRSFALSSENRRPRLGAGLWSEGVSCATRAYPLRASMTREVLARPTPGDEISPDGRRTTGGRYCLWEIYARAREGICLYLPPCGCYSSHRMEANRRGSTGHAGYAAPIADTQGPPKS
jgi:hypothetical protein